MQAATSCGAGVGLSASLSWFDASTSDKEAWLLFAVIPAQQPLRACLDDGTDAECFFLDKKAPAPSLETRQPQCVLQHVLVVSHQPA
jgi:hypothetical protein